jgi:hypothetical protein
VIPNARLADERVLNYYYPHPLHLEHVRVAVHYDEPPYRVRQVLLECAAGVSGVLDKPGPDVYVAAFEASAVIHDLRVWIEDMSLATRIASELRARIWEEFHRRGIVMPYPIQTVELARQAPRPRAAAPAEERPQARLYVAEGPERGRSLQLATDEPATVGRSRTCALALSDPNASKEHLRIAWETGSYVMTDLGSSFGTRLNGQAVSRAALAPLDRIAIGDTVMIFETDEDG